MQPFLFKSTLAALLAAGSISIALTANAATNANDHSIFTPKDMTWSDPPKSLPQGAKIVILEGDPAKEGPFTFRIKFPANYRIPPHWHPVIEHVTVISGNFYLGIGDKFDTKEAKLLPTDSFAYMPPEMHHFAFTRSEAVIQLHGMGPWGITYVDPKQDPRNTE